MTRSWRTLSFALALAIASCGPKIPKDDLPTLAVPPAGGPVQYVVAVGDQLGIKFYKNPELNEDVIVRPDGMISLQLVDDVPAAGRTPSDISADLRRRYSKELAAPAISVIVRKLEGDRIYVGGEVGKQGVIHLVAGLTLFQAIQEAGGFTKTAHRKDVVLIRRTPDGKAIGREIDVRPVQQGDRPQDDVVLAANDVIFVPRSKIANVDVFVEQYIRDALPINYVPIAF
jgi:polysaccharide export outer membrane protein